MTKDRVTIGLIGLGRMGQNHLRVLSLLKGAELAFIYDVDSSKRDALAESTGVSAANDVEAAIRTVEALIIASPTVTHAEYFAQAAPCVRNIFVEKPLAESAEKTMQIAELAQRYAVNLQVGFIERFNPAVQQLRKVLDRSEQVVMVDFTRTNKISARITDVDVVTDLMIHDVDLALHLNGKVTKVDAHGTANNRMIEFASALLTHEGGRFSRLMASRVTEKKMRLIQATCMDMFVECDLLRKEISITRQSKLVQPEGEPYAIIANEELLEVRPQEALVSQLQAFLQSCQLPVDDARPGAADALAAIEVCSEIQSQILLRA